MPKVHAVGVHQRDDMDLEALPELSGRRRIPEDIHHQRDQGLGTRHLRGMGAILTRLKRQVTEQVGEGAR